MNTTKTKKPPVSLTLTPEIYNALMYTLDDFKTRFENDPWIYDRSNFLKNKIEKYGRVSRDSNGDSVHLNFYEAEAANLIELLLYAIFPVVPENKFYFEKLRADYEQKKSANPN
jgi:hypothetical protein